jgi:hypothetical protein
MLAFVDTGLLERESEMARLTEVVDATAHGAGAVVLVEGEAGIGKSALLTRALEFGEPAGITVLSASGVALERAFGYGAARQLLERHMAKLAQARRRVLLKGAAPASAVLGLADDATVDGEDDGSARRSACTLSGGAIARRPQWPAGPDRRRSTVGRWGLSPLAGVPGTPAR